MRTRLLVLGSATLLGFAACSDGDDMQAATAAPPSDGEVILRAADGVPVFVGGDLGRAPANLDPQDAEAVMQPALAQIAPLFGGRAAQLRLVRADRDDLGYLHLRYRQEVNGLEVIGGQLDLHIDHRDVIYLANGSARDIAIPDSPTTSLADAVVALAARKDYRTLTVESSRLVYLVASRDDGRYLTWELTMSGTRGADPVRDLVYMDARGGSLIEVHPTIHMAKNRATYNLNHSTVLPGALVRSEGQGPSGEVDVDFAHDYAGDTYDCYQALFERDSFDNAGAQLVGSVHYSTNYVNAFWNGTQMVYGDGDGVNSGPLDRALDVVSHELTHAVTERESGLVYSNEPGALNEANSDSFAAMCESWKDGSVNSDTWKVGEDVWTPGIANDALRYMNNPTLDGSSRDYYPERYTGGQDNGGVHWNSGIPNLAFYLAVAGGQHPRNKTSIVVTGLGIDVASQIWYRAATIYYQNNSNMSAARVATDQAATDLFPLDPSVRQSVDDAWAAVGVPLPAPPPATVILSNGVPLTGTSGPPDRSYALDVPAGATSVTFTISGNSGDADLYGKFGSIPTTNDYEAKSESGTSNETITIPTNGRVGLYYAEVHVWSAYNNLSIVASYAAGTPAANQLQQNVEKTELSGSVGSRTPFTFKVPVGWQNVTFTTSGGPGNADLYIRKGSPPDIGAGQYDYRSIGGSNEESITVSGNKAGGNWYVLVYGTAAFNAMSIVAHYDLPYIRTYKNLSGLAGDKIRKTFVVPEGATKVTFLITGGTGDADLYVRFGAAPTLATWDYRPYLVGNEETVVITPPRIGTYYLMVNGKTDFSGVTLKGNAQ